MSKRSHGAQCESCRFYDDHKANAGRAQGDAGLCRFNPPVSQPSPDSRGLWPIVSAQDWCGHFSPTSIDAAQ